MLLVIDAGNTQTAFGFRAEEIWVANFRFATEVDTTEDELAAKLHSLCAMRGIPCKFDEIIYASVVPAMDAAIHALGEKWFGLSVLQISAAMDLGLTITYDPPTAVGADRIANALGALQLFEPPVLVVDFGTATTFDCIDHLGNYAGGSIMPGPLLGAQALVERTAKLPQIDLIAPPTALGRNTRHALQSGLVLGYAAAVEGLAGAIVGELGPGTTVIATGGLGSLFIQHCPILTSYEPNLTLDGLLVARQRVLHRGKSGE